MTDNLTPAPALMRQLGQHDLDALLTLHFHWGSAFVISKVGDTWTAIPVDDPSTAIRRDSAYDLLLAMRADYFARKGLDAPEPGSLG